MTRSFPNTHAIMNSFGEDKVDKRPRARTKRIDPVDAAVDAHAARMLQGGEPVDLESGVEEWLRMMGA